MLGVFEVNGAFKVFGGAAVHYLTHIRESFAIRSLSLWDDVLCLLPFGLTDLLIELSGCALVLNSCLPRTQEAGNIPTEARRSVSAGLRMMG